METKTVAKTALACKLLIFNALCLLIFLLWVPISLPFYLVAGFFRCVSDMISPIIEENKSIYLQHVFITKKENTKNHAHVMGPITKESVRNN
jgi:hypothetical protein